ncbi:GNAT family N-acetyltransferase [Streptomyces sp. SID9727]|nr:GNAT family N-acetyltransferase [Streptomyces sp. SID9727]NEC65794.1 GNAT family N-acetyltransferase [Streptomyces sp. SID9727]
MTVTIRPAGPDDLPPLAALIEEIERFYGATEIQPLAERRAQIEESLFAPIPLAQVLVADPGDGTLAGMAAYSFLWPARGTTHALFLKELYVSEPWRGGGVGARLMAELRTVASARPGCSRMEWMGDTDNAPALGFYGALGFEVVEGKAVYRVGVEG